MKNKGFIAILTVIALLAFSLSLIVAVTYLSIGEARSALALSQGRASLALAESCAEDALLQITRDESYTGEDYSYLGGICHTSVSQEDTVWTLDVSATKDAFTRTVQVVFDYTPGEPGIIVLQGWLEQ